jgi:hypothetical protein
LSFTPPGRYVLDDITTNGTRPDGQSAGTAVDYASAVPITSAETMGWLRAAAAAALLALTFVSGDLQALRSACGSPRQV